MKNLYCIICCKYRKFVKSKTSCVLEKALILSIIWLFAVSARIKMKKN